MLRNKLNSILSVPDPARYGNRYWTYAISNNWLELIIPHQFRNDPEAYRLAVIHCGQVIKSILTLAEERDHLQVKTFPDLDKSHIVAMIRDYSDSQYTGKGENIPCPETDMIANDFDLIRLLASFYNFQPIITGLSSSPDSSSTDKETKPINTIEIYSKDDNPMVWLKTGYFLECFLQKKESENIIQPYDISLSLHTSKDNTFPNNSDNFPYRQLLLKEHAF